LLLVALRVVHTKQVVAVLVGFVLLLQQLAVVAL